MVLMESWFKPMLKSQEIAEAAHGCIGHGCQICHPAGDKSALELARIRIGLGADEIIQKAARELRKEGIDELDEFSHRQKELHRRIAGRPRSW